MLSNQLQLMVKAQMSTYLWPYTIMSIWKLDLPLSELFHGALFEAPAAQAAVLKCVSPHAAHQQMAAALHLVVPTGVLCLLLFMITVYI